jgi:hypothetical protein
MSDTPATVATNTLQTTFGVSILKKACVISTIALSVTAVPVNMVKAMAKASVIMKDMVMIDLFLIKYL